MTARLHAVPAPADERIDIGALLRAERSDPERWARVHIAGDRNPPLPWFERVRRTWRG